MVMRPFLFAFLAHALAFCLAAAPASAADRRPIERNLLRQQQQSDSFTLRSRQAAEELRAPAPDAAGLRDLHTRQRQQQDMLHSQQLQRLQQPRALPDDPGSRALRRAERQRMENESALQLQQFELERRTRRSPLERPALNAD
ncbi:MAG: hypothetical protein IRY96_01880 [Burkholderiales bacterium]|nr:hypothetical protein [Burkholderiales bacterium]PZN06374.1 MAG: hypothetical protein DIU74_00140 [Pseudomonadota bacterium]